LPSPRPAPRSTRLVATSVALVAIALTPAQAAEDASAPLRLDLRASAVLASFDGELQTPMGGQAGTTSKERPETNEVGLDGLGGFATASLELHLFEKHILHLSYTSLDRTGSETLDRELITHGQTFPRGARVKSRLELPFGRLGYRMPFEWGPLRIAPEVGASRLDFAYQLSATEATGKADRAYVIYFAYWGAALDVVFSERLRGEWDLYASAGLSNLRSIDSDLRVLVRVFEKPWLRTDLVLGLRGIWLHYKDDQEEEQNDIDVRVGAFSRRPWAGVHLGFQLGF